MGAGNYLPPTDECYPHIIEDMNIRGDPVYEMVYVDSNYAADDDTDPIDVAMAQEAFEADLLADIEKLLSSTFRRDKKKWTLESKILRVTLKGEYEGIYYPLIITPTHPLGLSHISRVSKQLFGGLARHGYDISVRAGAWTSSPYQEGVSA